MKTEIIHLASNLVLIAGLSCGSAVFASQSTEMNKALAGSTAMELPANAAKYVSKAAALSKADTAAAVVKTAVAINPAAAAAIVSAVAMENPSTAPISAVTAVTAEHKQLARITRAAAQAAPAQAGKIVAALIKEFPQDYGVIAVSASEGAPAAGRQILDAVADYVPALHTSIEAVTAHFAANDANIPVRAVLGQSYQNYKSALTIGGVANTKSFAGYDATLNGTTPVLVAQNAGGAGGVGPVAAGGSVAGPGVSSGSVTQPFQTVSTQNANDNSYNSHSSTMQESSGSRTQTSPTE